MNCWSYLKSVLPSQNAMLLVVAESIGSSPGRQGFKMVITENYELFGSIGGGIMEYNLVELAKEYLTSYNFNPILKRQIHKGKIIDGSGMICSGEQTIIMYKLNKTDLNLIDKILSTIQTNKLGLVNFNNKGIIFYKTNLPNKYNYKYENKNKWLLQENLIYKEHLYIIGGGHVSLATSQLFNQLGFQVTVLDNRSNLNTFIHNTYAHFKYVIDYNKTADYIPENEQSFVVVMTNKYTEDKLALSQLIGKKYNYLGVLGSKSKLHLMFSVFEKEGYSKNDLKHIYRPLGLPIHSKTPFEIAISIAAQIIKVKNK